jgi:phasin
MASSSKKFHRPAVKVERAPAAKAPQAPAPAVVEAPAPRADEVLALEAAVASAPKAVEPQGLFAPLDPEAVEPPAREAPATVETAKAVETPVAAKDLQGAANQAQKDMRAFLEKNIVDSRAKYAQAKSAAEEATAAIEASYGAARDGVVAFNVRAIEAIKAETDANFDLLASLAGAKSVSDAVTLQAEFARKWFEDASARAKELAELARKVADDAAAPIRAHVAKTFKVAV